jgi:UDP-N-acetylmuramate dehydrogenase
MQNEKLKISEIFPEGSLRGEIRFNEPMSKHTSFKIGGHADVMFFPEDALDLKTVLLEPRNHGIPIFILGMGTNLLVRDGGIQGITINLKNLNRMKIVDDSLVYAEAGVPLPRLLSFAAENGLEGLEFAAGIPGAVGGAIIMNAGTKEGEMKDVLDRVTLMNLKGELRVFKKEEIPFGYRKSGLEGAVVLGASFKLKKGEPDEIKKRIKDLIRERSGREPSGLPNAGSIFKNPAGDSAGRIIDELGLKGFRIGDAEVSQVHANFIVNKGKAKASDVISLMRIIEERVFKERNIVLEPEIRVVGRE